MLCVQVIAGLCSERPISGTSLIPSLTHTPSWKEERTWKPRVKIPSPRGYDEGRTGLGGTPEEPGLNSGGIKEGSLEEAAYELKLGG